jgi:eukaryotic-like serine/threonine-protein kinase
MRALRHVTVTHDPVGVCRVWWARVPPRSSETEKILRHALAPIHLHGEMRAANTGQMVGTGVQLVRQLATGSTSTVWLAQRNARGGAVAVKLLDARLLKRDGQEVVRFHREAKILEELKSAHSVRVLEHGLTADRQPFLVMELLRGLTLEARLRRDRRLSITEVTRLVQQLTGALTEAHELGVIHRDVSADNVFLVCAEALYAKLLDFGLAKHMRSGHYAVSTSDAIRGSMLAVAPEQVDMSRGVDHRIDLWALGILAYRALTGEHPFQHADYHQTIALMRQGVFKPVSDFSSVSQVIPPALDDWFELALAPNPDDRFSSAEEMAAAWMRAVGEEDSCDAFAAPTNSMVRLAASDDTTEIESAQRLIAAVEREMEGAPDDADLAAMRVVEDVTDFAATQMLIEDEDDFAATAIFDTEQDQNDPPTGVAAFSLMDEDEDDVTVVRDSEHDEERSSDSSIEEHIEAVLVLAPRTSAPPPLMMTPTAPVRAAGAAQPRVVGPKLAQASARLMRTRRVAAICALLAGVAVFAAAMAGVLWSASQSDGQPMPAATEMAP